MQGSLEKIERNFTVPKGHRERLHLRKTCYSKPINQPNTS